ncbi:transposase [Yoonia sp.]|uniref:REP-associated tyrosine transposase n=1 Tax=Yoonia sp. TaxID=2212373 RepID=UPI001A02FD97|nr:transposase [Yoonia sp.]MBE0412599.1 transposase [Yoonia sp.]
MTRYRRYRRTGGTYFFTVNLADRTSTLLVDHIDTLRQAFVQTSAERHIIVNAMVILPDHLHAVWTLPECDADYSTRWRLIKSRFSRTVGTRQPRSASQVAKQERGIWQRRFWEHTIRNECDYNAHIAYCWGNPVKHGLVARAADWPFSSIHRDIKAGLVNADW